MFFRPFWFIMSFQAPPLCHLFTFFALFWPIIADKAICWWCHYFFPAALASVLSISNKQSKQQKNISASWFMGNKEKLFHSSSLNRRTAAQSRIVFVFRWIFAAASIYNGWEGDFMVRNRFLSSKVKSNLFLLLLALVQIVFGGWQKLLLLSFQSAQRAYGM